MENDIQHDQIPMPATVEKQVAVKPTSWYLWLIALAVIILGIMGMVMVRRFFETPSAAPIQMTASATLSPTPVRILSTLSSLESFIAIEKSQASLSSQLANTNLDDPSLSPPVIDLRLGFSQ